MSGAFKFWDALEVSVIATEGKGKERSLGQNGVPEAPFPPTRIHLQGFPECLGAAPLLSRPNTQRVSLQVAFSLKRQC